MTRQLYLVLFLLLFVFPQNSFSQAIAPYDLKITNDSLPLKFKGQWRYHAGDNPLWASPNFSDDNWTVRNSRFYNKSKDDSTAAFPGIGWFRMRIAIDTTLVGKPLALSLSHSGAAEVWVNGHKLNASGVITAEGKIEEGSHLFEMPAIVALPSAGVHLIAIRFAESAAETDEEYQSEACVFSLTIGEADATIKKNHRVTMLITAVTFFFFSFFFAFALLHLFLFLYHRAGRSNLWFSLFCLGLGLLFLAIFLAGVAQSTAGERWMDRYGTLLVTATCAAISAFVNDLFGWRRTRFYLAISTLLTGIVCVIVPSLEDYVLPLLIALVFIEAIILITRAIYMKVPGARIIGAGILLFALMVIVIFIIVLTGIEINAETFGSRKWLTVVVLLVATIFIAIISIPLSMSAYLAWSFATVNKRLNKQLFEVERLSEAALKHEAEKQRMLETRKEELEVEVSIRTEELRGQKAKSDALLLNILPAEVAEELKEKGSARAKLYSDVSVLFTDFADFTQIAEKLTPDELVAELNECFSAFDGIITRHGLEKIKTVGDAYIAVGGLPTENVRHAQDIVVAALEIRNYMQSRKKMRPETFEIRLGVHSGSLVAGIVGVKKFAYDIWGDTVNTAARMEQHSEVGKLNISAATYELVKDEFLCSYRGELDAKHKGKLGMYFVEDREERGSF